MSFRFLVASAAIFSISFASSAHDSDTLNVFEIRADMKAFMCPHLSPIYMKMIEKSCDCPVQKTNDLVIHVYGKSENEIDEKRLLELADRTGYDPRMIHITKVK